MMTEIDKLNIAQFFKDYPKAAEILNKKDFNTFFKLLSYTEISDADMIILLQDAGIDISANDVTEYHMGIDHDTCMSIMSDVEKLAVKLDWDGPACNIDECFVKLEKSFFDGEPSNHDISALCTKVGDILARYSSGDNIYDYTFSDDEEWGWEDDEDSGYTIAVWIYFFNKWNLKFKGQPNETK